MHKEHGTCGTYSADELYPMMLKKDTFEYLGFSNIVLGYSWRYCINNFQINYYNKMGKSGTFEKKRCKASPEVESYEESSRSDQGRRPFESDK